jgi:hypothetical protein
MAYGRMVGVIGAALAGLVAASVPSGAAQAAPPGTRALAVVTNVGQVSQQDLPPQPGSEPDTLVEPDVAVSPVNPNIAVAVTHNGRFPDGGAVGINYAWTHDGGRSWHHAPLPGVSKASGGTFDRASDPVVAFGPDGSVYVSTLLVSLDCPSGVAVSRSTDGGRTFHAPVLAHESDDCAFSDDKNWLVVDNGRLSPHRGRLYQFWTPFLSDAAGNTTGSPQVVRWSDDQGQHWGPIVTISASNVFTQNSQPMIRQDGTIVDAYLNFGADQGDEGPERPGTGLTGQTARPRATPAEEETGDLLVASTSRDGGRTWSAETEVTHDIGEGPAGIRCCLPSATIDPVTGLMYAAWDSVDPALVLVSISRDGRHWSAPVQVNREDSDALDHVNVDVSAFGGRVFVSYGTRDTTVAGGTLVQQQVSISPDGGRHFAPALSVGPPSDLRFAAQARGRFPGDYIGTAATAGRTYVVWCRSSQPADPAATFHQVLFGAVLRD